MMLPDEVIRALDRLGSANLKAWLDGGWGVDALLGRQSRPHDDLDLVMALTDVDKAVAALAPLGYTLTADERPTRIVLATRSGYHVDIHTVTFDADGNGWQEIPDSARFAYTREGLDGRGIINGRLVRCLSPELQLACHLGYEPDATDRADMQLLAARFGLELPPILR